RLRGSLVDNCPSTPLVNLPSPRERRDSRVRLRFRPNKEDVVRFSVGRATGKRALLGIALLALAAACKTPAPGSEAKSDTSQPQNYDTEGGSWQAHGEERNKEIVQYFKDNARDWDWFEHQPLGFNGVPVLVLKSLIAAFPEIWAPDGTLNQMG